MHLFASVCVCDKYTATNGSYRSIDRFPKNNSYVELSHFLTSKTAIQFSYFSCSMYKYIDTAFMDNKHHIPYYKLNFNRFTSKHRMQWENDTEEN